MFLEKLDYMEGMSRTKHLETLEQSIEILSKDWIKEGFDEQDIYEFVLSKVKKCLASAE